MVNNKLPRDRKNIISWNNYEGKVLTDNGFRLRSKIYQRGSFKNLKPKISLKISPENTKDLSSDNDHRIDVNNIFNLDRLSVSDTVEGGLSLAYGSDYTIFDNVKNREVFSLKLANNLRLNENKDLPQNNQLGEKTSNFSFLFLSNSATPYLSGSLTG